MANREARTALALERWAYLVGHPIAHSQSPLLHQILYSDLSKSWGMIPYETSNLPEFMRVLKEEPKCFGSAVTMPFKVEIMQYLDELAPEGKAIGAINTIYFKTDEDGNRVCVGTNTDWIGVRESFARNVPKHLYRSKPGLVVGGGGTCRAALYTMQTSFDCSQIYIVNRDADEVQAIIQQVSTCGLTENIIHVTTVAQARILAPPGAIVSAVPDIAPVTENEKMAREILKVFLSSNDKGALLEMCYHPSPNTQISALASGLGWPVIMGSEALVAQGVEQARLWTGLEVRESSQDAAMISVRAAILSKQHNKCNLA